jgi:hypothetical protein
MGNYQPGLRGDIKPDLGGNIIKKLANTPASHLIVV